MIRSNLGTRPSLRSLKTANPGLTIALVLALLLVLVWSGNGWSQTPTADLDNTCVGAGGTGSVCANDDDCSDHTFATVCVQHDANDPGSRRCEVSCGLTPEDGADGPTLEPDEGACALGEVCVEAEGDGLYYCRASRFRVDLNLLDQCVAHFLEGVPPVLGQRNACSLEANLARLLDQDGDLEFDIFDVDLCVRAFLDQPECDLDDEECEDEDLRFCREDDECGDGLYCDPTRHHCTRECGLVASREAGFSALERGCSGRLKACNFSRGRCEPVSLDETQCQVDGQCPEGAYCFLGRCAPTCSRSLDCPDSSWFCAENGRCNVQPSPEGDPDFAFDPGNYAVLFGTSSVTLTAIEDEQSAPVLIMDLTTKREVRNNPSVGFGYRIEVSYAFKQSAECLTSPEDWTLDEIDECLIDPTEEFVTPLAPFGTVRAAGRPAMGVRLNRAAADRLSPGSYVATVNAIFDNGSQDRFLIYYDKLTPSGEYSGTMTVALGRPQNTLEGRTQLGLALKIHISDDEVRWNALLSANNLVLAGGEDIVDLTQGQAVVGYLLANRSLPFALPGARRPDDNKVPIKGIYSPRDGTMRLIGVIDLPAAFCQGENGACTTSDDELQAKNPFGRPIRRVFQLVGSYEDATRRFYGTYRERISGLVPGSKDLTLNGAFLLDQTEFDPSALPVSAPLIPVANQASISFPAKSAVETLVEAQITANCKGDSASHKAIFATSSAYRTYLNGDSFPILSDLVSFEDMIGAGLDTLTNDAEHAEGLLTLYDYLAGWVVPCDEEDPDGVLGRGGPTACVDEEAARCGLALYRKALIKGHVVGTSITGTELPLFCSAVIPVDGCDIDPETEPVLSTYYEHNRFHQELSQALKFLADRDLSDAFFTLYRHRANPFAQGAALSFKAERLRSAFGTYGKLLDLFLAPEGVSVMWYWPMSGFQSHGNEWLRQMQLILTDRLEVQRQLVDLRRRTLASTDRNDRLFAEHLAQHEYLVQVYMMALQQKWQGSNFRSLGEGAEIFATLQMLLLQLHEDKNPLGISPNQVFFESSDPSLPNWQNYLVRLVGDDGEGGMMARARREIDEAVDNLQASLRDVDALEDRIFGAQLEYEDRLTELCGPAAMSNVKTVCDLMVKRLATAGELDPEKELEKVCTAADWPDPVLASPATPSPDYDDECDAVVDFFNGTDDLPGYDLSPGDACPLSAARSTIEINSEKRVCIGGEMGALMQERQVLMTDLAGMALPIMRAFREIEAYLHLRHNEAVLRDAEITTRAVLATVEFVLDGILTAVDTAAEIGESMTDGVKCMFVAGFSIGTDCPQKIGAALAEVGISGTKVAVRESVRFLVKHWDKITDAAVLAYELEAFDAETDYEVLTRRFALGADLDNFGVVAQSLVNIEMRIAEVQYQAQYAADRMEDTISLTLDHLVGRETGSVLVGNQWVGRSAKTFAAALDTTYRMVSAFNHRYNLANDEANSLVNRVYQAVTLDDIDALIDTMLEYDASYCGLEGIDCDAFNNLSVLRVSLRDELFPHLRDLVDPRTGRVVTKGEQFHNLINSPPYLRRRARGPYITDQIEIPFTVWLQMLEFGGRQRWLIDPTQCNHLVDGDPGLAEQGAGSAGTVAVNIVGRNLDDSARSIRYELVRGHADWIRSCHAEPVIEEVGTAPQLDFPIRTQIVGYAPQSIEGMQPSPPTYVTRSVELPACTNQPEQRGELVGPDCWRFFARDRSLAAPDWMMILPLRIGGAESGNTWLTGEGLREEERPMIENIVVYLRYRSRPTQEY